MKTGLQKTIIAVKKNKYRLFFFSSDNVKIWPVSYELETYIYIYDFRLNSFT
jgi:hypothetical protein